MKNIMKPFSIVLATVFLLSFIPFFKLQNAGIFEVKSYAVDATSGTCGSSVNWQYDESTCELFITGTGEMTDFDSSDCVPWKNYRQSIIGAYIDDGILNVGNYAFYDCNEINFVVLPDTVSTIGDYSFYGCSNFEMDTLGDGIKSVGENSFQYCTGITQLNFPNTISVISEGAFEYCTNLKGIYLPDSIKKIDNLAFYNTGLTSVTLPDSVESVGDYSFAECQYLSEIDFGKGLKSIGKFAFSVCEEISNIIIPDSVNQINDYAFKSCSGLKTITLGKGLNDLGENVFLDCSQISTFNVDENNNSYSQINNVVLINKSCDRLIMFAPNTDFVEYTLPSAITEISSYAFYNCSELKEIILPSALTEIGPNAFKSCSSLESITLPIGVTAIADELFCNCSKLSSIALPDKLESIGSGAFMMCSSISNLEFPETLSYIAESCFYGCTALKQVNLPDSINHIGNEAFFGCSNLEKVYFPESIKEFNDRLFEDCESLKTIQADGVNKIGDYVFFGCKALSQYVVNDEVKSIGKMAFDSCDSLAEITIPKSVESIDKTAFYDTSLTVIYGSVLSYAHTFAKENNIKFVSVAEKEMTIPDGKTTVINSDSGIIYGLEANITSLNDYIELKDGCSFVYSQTSNGFGTGTKVDITDSSGAIIDSFEIVIFGDADGDGQYDGTDSFLVSLISQGMLTRDDVGESVYTAADCNHDGVIDTKDVELLESAGILAEKISQSDTADTVATSAKYNSMIVQTVDNVKTEDKDETVNILFEIFSFVLNLIKKILFL